MAKGRRRRADGLATRERIITSATEMFAASGYEGTSLRQIAAAASIDIATLKYHYTDKPTLFAQVYAQNYEVFAAAVAPVIAAFIEVRDTDALRDVLHLFSSSMHDFAAENLPFIKLTLYRVIEQGIDVIELEDELQVAAITMLSDVFDELARREVVAPVDSRALSAFLISSFCTWQVLARTKQDWVGPPSIQTDEGRVRSEAFFVSTLEKVLGV